MRKVIDHVIEDIQRLHKAGKLQPNILLEGDGILQYREAYHEQPGFDCIADYELLKLVIILSDFTGDPKLVTCWLQAASTCPSTGLMDAVTREAIEAHGAHYLHCRVLADFAEYIMRGMSVEFPYATSLLKTLIQETL